MAINGLQLPGAIPSSVVDWSPLAQLSQQYKQAQQEALRRDTLQSIGQGPLDASAVQKLISSGDMSLSQLGVGLANTNYQRGRDTINDERSLRNDAFSQKLQMENLAIAKQNLANNSEGPEETASQRAAAAKTYGLSAGTPEFKAFVLTGALPEGNTTVQAQTSQREQAAARIGLKSDHPAYQSFILTGKMPREDAQPLTATDKKAILEADESVQSSRGAVDSLKRASALSKEAFTGPTAAMRGYAASFLGPNSDIGKAGIATEGLKNEVESNALSQLKAIFGGNPTEGERKILLDIQGSAAKSPEVREEIYKRASNAAQRRMDFSQQRADALRGNTFYKPNGTPATALPPAGQPAPQQAVAQSQGAGADAVLAQARDAIARGAPREAVLQRLQQAGVDASGL